MPHHTEISTISSYGKSSNQLRFPNFFALDIEPLAGVQAVPWLLELDISITRSVFECRGSGLMSFGIRVAGQDFAVLVGSLVSAGYGESVGTG